MALRKLNIVGRIACNSKREKKQRQRHDKSGPKSCWGGWAMREEHKSNEWTNIHRLQKI